MPNTIDQQLMVPRKLFTLSTKRIAEFAAGPFHTLALTYDGFMYAFGNSKEGKLGIKLAEQQVGFRIDDDDGDERVVNNVVDFPTMLTNAPKFSVQGEQQQVFKSYERFQAFTSEGIMNDEDEVKRLKVIQTACSDNNSYFLLSSGMIYATGANDRWQCSEIEEAKIEMDLIDEEYLKPHRKDDNLAERGGPVIPDAAAEIIRQA